MNDSALFSYDHFLSLGGSELVNYVEPFVNTEMRAVPKSVYDPLHTALETFDEVHTVYALELCMLLKPTEFVNRAADFLSRPDASVCSTACRIIKRLSPNSMPTGLMKKIAATPITDLFATNVRTGERIRVGTNEAFIRDLVEWRRDTKTGHR
jgi:hypothetical protein